LVFAGARWTWNEEGDNNCVDGGPVVHTKITAEFPLPEPLQNPITLLSGNGKFEAPPDVCASGDFDASFERTGD
jgi:serine/threonine-protein kinase